MERYKNLCRICIKEDGIKIPIFGEEGQYRGVAAKIKDCLKVPLYPNDPLPKQICNCCFYKLELATEVKEICQRSNAIFIHHLSTQRGNSAAREYLNLVQDRPQHMPPPQQGQKRKLPDGNGSHQNDNEPQRKRPALERQSHPPKPRSAVPNRLTVLPRSDALSRTRSSGASPQLPSTSSSLFQVDTYSCHICDKTSTSRKVIQEHERRDHTTREFLALGKALDYVCTICERRFETPKSLKMHSIKYHKVRLSHVTANPMPSCDSPCPTNSLLGIKIEPAEDLHNFECNICYQICSDENALHEHFTSTHKQITSPSTSTNEVTTEADDLPLTKPECIFCFQTFKNNSGLVVHLRTAHGKPSCVVCLEIFSTQEELLLHRNVHKNINTTPKKTNEELLPSENVAQVAEGQYDYTCDKCGKSFERSISYARHRASHTRRGPSWVPQDVLAAQETALLTSNNANLTHNNTTNSQISDTTNSEQAFVEASGSKVSVQKLKRNNSKVPYCLYCKKIFDNYKKLWDHVRKVHPNNPRYKCPHNNCGRIFFGKPGYRSHLSTHKNDESPAVVSNGDNTASQSQETNPSLEQGTAQCFVCLKTFFNFNNMRRHFMDIHKNKTNYQCTECAQFYGTQKNLDEHTKNCHSQLETSQKITEPTIPLYKYDYNKKVVGGKTKVYVYPRVLCRYCPKYLSKKYVSEHEKLHRKSGLKPLMRNTVTNVTTNNQNDTKEEKEDDEEEEEVNGIVPKETGQKSIFKKNKKAICKYCKNIFDSFKLLEIHLINKHSDKPYIKCPLCPHIYYDNQALKSHNSCHNRSHKKCKHCERTFVYHNYLKVHEKSCSRKKGNANNAIAKPPPVAKPAAKTGDVSTPIYTCDFCGAQFLETQLFVKHLQGHANAL